MTPPRVRLFPWWAWALFVFLGFPTAAGIFIELFSGGADRASDAAISAGFWSAIVFWVVVVALRWWYVRRYVAPAVAASTAQVDALQQANAAARRAQLATLQRAPLQPIAPPGFAPKPNEKCYWAEEDSTIITVQTHTERVGSYRGVSMRVPGLRGMRVYTGGSRGHTIKTRSAEADDMGTLYVTSDRLVFVGSHQTRTVPLDKIVRLEPFRDGVRLDVENSSPIVFTASDHALATVVQRVKLGYIDSVPDGFKTLVTVTLVNCGSEKIKVIMAIRDLLGVGLTEAKEIVEKTPSVLAADVEEDVAQTLYHQFSALGAQIDVG